MTAEDGEGRTTMGSKAAPSEALVLAVGTSLGREGAGGGGGMERRMGGARRG
jgi:hypothetical protein